MNPTNEIQYLSFSYTSEKHSFLGRVSAIKGPPKSGKTNLCSVILASALSKTESSSLTHNRDLVYLHFDQDITTTQQINDSIIKYAGQAEQPKNLHVVNLAGYPIQIWPQLIDGVFNNLNPQILVIDELADIIPSVNDEVMAMAMLDKLAQLASKHNTCVMVVIKENNYNGSTRGHLRGLVDLKCARIVSLSKD